MQATTRLLELLAGGDVEFVVVGGYAAVLHGSSYVTQDLDVLRRLFAREYRAAKATSPG